MGLQNALFSRGHSFASDEAVEFNDEFMEAIACYAYEASSDLAAERGTYSSYKGSKWDRGLLPQDTLPARNRTGPFRSTCRDGRLDWQSVRDKIARQGMRNSNVLAIAPPRPSPISWAPAPCIEPTYKNLFVKIQPLR
jgi:ribonucleoside-diphosphate reductase alpha chain